MFSKKIIVITYRCGKLKKQFNSIINILALNVTNNYGLSVFKKKKKKYLIQFTTLSKMAAIF